MVLYGVTGNSLEMDADVWRQLLAAATSRGWQSRGTTAPPRAVLPGPAQPSPSWAGDYAQPQGQEVTRRDAAGLASSLRAFAASADAAGVPPALSPFLEICDHGGFVICAGASSPSPQTENSESQFSHSLAGLAMNLGAAVPPRRSPVTALRKGSEIGLRTPQSR